MTALKPLNTAAGDLIRNILNGDGSIWDIFAEPYTASMGEAAFALILSGVIAATLLSWTRSYTLTAVWIALSGGFFLVLIPPQAATALVIAVTIVLGIAFYSIYSTNTQGR